MQIYFEDGKLINSKLLPIIPNFIINAEDGVTSCINQLDNINSVKPCAIIYTNSIFALNGKYAWNMEDDDTYNIRFTENQWIIEKRGKILYSTKR